MCESPAPSAPVHFHDVGTIPLYRPVADCGHVDPHDGTCAHPANPSPECWQYPDGCRSSCPLLDGPLEVTAEYLAALPLDGFLELVDAVLVSGCHFPKVTLAGDLVERGTCAGCAP